MSNLELDLVGFDFYFSFNSLMFVIIDQVVLIRNKSYFGVDHGRVELECKLKLKSCLGIDLYLIW